ncbi:MAG: glycerol-3-phosphate acyltransferase [Armatimonadetes bacterium]|nr:glycerol-3-phosphate acyltransferase [Armatimonadota bacterium]
MEEALLLTAAGYLIGSVPFGYLLVRLVCGKDVRRYGSHNIGAVNVSRVAGRCVGLVTLALDAGKAFAMVLVAASLTTDAAVVAAAGFAVLLGHSYSAWFLLVERRLSGGKSVASGLGVLLALAELGAIEWWSVEIPIAVWTAGLIGPRILTGRWWCVSPATLAATVSAPVAVWLGHPVPAYLAMCLAMSGLIVVRHRGNIARLATGSEPRIGETAEAAAPQLTLAARAR